MNIELIQMISITIIIIIFGIAITYVNLRKKINAPVSKEQNSWQRIENLNDKKKELIRQKEDASLKYGAKSINDETYTNTLKFITSELNKIDTEINQEVSKLTELQKTQDTGSDLRFQNIRLKGELNETKLEKENLKQRVKELEEFIKNISGSKNISVSANESIQNKYYELILDKYKEEINEQERKTISQIKEMVSPNDLTIKSVVGKYKPVGYDYNKDYIDTLKRIYNFIKSEIDIIKIDIKVLYWMDATTVLKNKYCDDQDAASLLCSTMQALNDYDALVYVVLLDNEQTHSFVKTKYKNLHYIFDLTQKCPFEMYSNTDESKLFENYKFNGNKIKKIIYKYNQNIYVDAEDWFYERNRNH